MAKKNTNKGTILLDFLSGVIITLVIFIGFLTYLNVTLRKENSIKEISRAAKYIAENLNEIAKDTIIYGDLKEMEKKIIRLKIKDEKDIFAIKLDQAKTDDKLKTIYSSREEDKKTTIKIEKIKEKLKENKYIEGESNHSGVHTYDFIYTIQYEDEVLGMLSVIFSMENLDNDIKKLFFINIILLITSIVIIIIFTTFILNRRIYIPIERLRMEVRKIKNGEIAYKVGLKENNELKLLADEINDMKSVIWSNNIDDRFADPITGLPGFMFILEKINEKIENDEFFTTCAINLKYTEAFILYYGLANGEEILRFIARIIHECIDELKIEDSAIAQIRENHYLLVLKPEIADEFGEFLVEKFDQEVITLYRDKEVGESISFETKNGDELNHPMMSVVATTVTNKLRGEIQKYKDIEDRVLEVEKYYYDSLEGSVFISYEDFIKSKDKGEFSSINLDAGKEDDNEGVEDLLEGLGLDDDE